MTVKNTKNNTSKSKTASSTRKTEFLVFGKKTPSLDDFIVPSAQCPQFMEFLATIAPDEVTQNAIQLMFGYMIARNITDNKMFWLFGEGENEKAILLEILSSLIGTNRISHFELSDLFFKYGKIHKNNFDRIKEKEVNISNECCFTHCECSISKVLREGLEKSLTKHIFSSYREPKYSVLKIGKIVFIPFHIRIIGNKERSEIANNIISKELEGILNFAIEGYNEILKTRKH